MAPIAVLISATAPRSVTYIMLPRGVILMSVGRFGFNIRQGLSE